MNRDQLRLIRTFQGPPDERYFTALHVSGESDDTMEQDPRPEAAATGSGPIVTAMPAKLADMLAGIEQFLARHVVFARPEALIAVTLWVAHTHAIDHADATPYLGISSPVRQSGKTRLLECLALLARGCSGILVTPTAATIYRSLDATPGATLLIDELDAVFGDRSDRHEELRAVINAGHRRGATVPRSVPGPKGTWVVKPFQVFCPKALAGIGTLPDTIADRSIPIRMRKRKPSEPITRFRERVVRGEAEQLVAGLVAALASDPPNATAAVPDELPDRAADAWEPLLAIADAAGGSWPTRARSAAIVLQASRADENSHGLRLLADVRVAFDRSGADRLGTAELLTSLAADEESPWAGDRAPLTPHRLGRLLAPFEIASRKVRFGARTARAYERSAFVDAWERYLPAQSSPLKAEHRNTERDRCSDVPLSDPPEGGSERDLVDLPVEADYPRSAWDPDWWPAPAQGSLV